MYRKRYTTLVTTIPNVCFLSTLFWISIVLVGTLFRISGNTNHCYHTLVPLTYCSIGTKQLSTSKLDDINRLHKASVSSAIQQNILFTNNNLIVDYQTILNKQASDRNAINKKITNTEQLLDELKNKAIYHILCYILNQLTHENIIDAPHYDSGTQKTIKQLMIKNNKNQLCVLLVVGWARNEDLRILRKKP